MVSDEAEGRWDLWPPDSPAGRRVFELDEARWAAFMAVLDAPVTDNSALRTLLARKPAWEG